MPKHLAFLTLHTYDGQAEETAAIIAALKEHGITVAHATPEEIAAEPQRFAAVVFQTASGYHHDIESYRALIRRLESLGLPLINPAALLLWNCDKSYLRELQAKGHAIVPTVWADKGTPLNLSRFLTEQGWTDVILKPTVSAGAHLTKRLSLPADKPMLTATEQWLGQQLAERAMMLQPFAPEIETEGEWSFLFFGNQFSHCILKKPKPKDWRVQHVHGGRYERLTPPPELLNQAQAVLRDLPAKPVHARVDGIRRDGRLLLMEIELIEPSLFLLPHDTIRHAPSPHEIDAANRYAAAIAAVLSQTRSHSKKPAA